jgi:hypothetical protein
MTLGVAPRFAILQPETLTRIDGRGPEFRLGARRGKLLVVTLNIVRVVEQGSLQISIWGSADGVVWRQQPMAVFPQKSYCGAYSRLLNLAAWVDTEYLRVTWRTLPWAKRDLEPLFEFSVLLEESGDRVSLPGTSGPRKLSDVADPILAPEYLPRLESLRKIPMREAGHN